MPQKALMEKQILKAAAAFIASRKVTRWTKDQHIAFLTGILTALVNAGKVAEMAKALDVHGLGGNASQFRQKLEALNADKDSEWFGKFPLTDEKAALSAFVADLQFDEPTPQA